MSELSIFALIALYGVVAIGFGFGVDDAMDDAGVGSMPDKGFAVFTLAALWPATAILFLARRLARWLTGGP